MSEIAVEHIVGAASAAYPKETGGIIFGVLSRGKPWITDAVEIPSKMTSSCHYSVPKGERPRLISRLKKRDERLGYLGDWHSHTADIGPSPDDEKSMQRIVQSKDSAKPYNVLIVARRKLTSYALDVSVWDRRGYHPVQIILAGCLKSS